MGEKKEIVFSKEAMERLLKFQRADDRATFLVLGADEEGVVQDFEEVKIDRKQCYTPTMSSKQFARAVIELYKRDKLTIGLYIVDSAKPNPISGEMRSSGETVQDWYRMNNYALSGGNLLEDEMVYVKEGKTNREKTTAGTLHSQGRMLKVDVRVLET